DQSNFAQPTHEAANARAALAVLFGDRHKHADAPHPIRLLPTRRKWPCRRAAEKRHECAPVHSITLSARSRIDSEIERPIAVAALRFTTSSNLTACSTGSSLGFAPLSTRSTY